MDKVATGYRMTDVTIENTAPNNYWFHSFDDVFLGNGSGVEEDMRCNGESGRALTNRKFRFPLHRTCPSS
jgi:hypothetical protein